MTELEYEMKRYDYSKKMKCGEYVELNELSKYFDLDEIIRLHKQFKKHYD